MHLGCLMDALVSSLVLLLRMESHIHGTPGLHGLPAAEHVHGPDLAPAMVGLGGPLRSRRRQRCCAQRGGTDSELTRAH